MRLWREAHLEVKMYKAHQGRTTFGSCDVEKMLGVVARSTFRSRDVEKVHAVLFLREAYFQVKFYKTLLQVEGEPGEHAVVARKT